jgi:RimJ/RimL family protein N-acetyltransferase
MNLIGERVLLRPWRESDLAPFAALNADPRVMTFMPGRLTRADSDRLALRIARHFRQHGFGLWAVELMGEAPFIGCVGLAVPGFQAPFTPCVEIGWRLAHDHWGRGYAGEAARVALGVGFGDFGLERIVSFTTRDNKRSRQVMERLGMTHSLAEDFDHPALPTGHPLRPHVLYRLGREEWRFHTGEVSDDALAKRPRHG